MKFNLTTIQQDNTKYKKHDTYHTDYVPSNDADRLNGNVGSAEM
jgi:hypothetical protein